MKRYDLHSHTFYSKCSNNKPEMILKQAHKAKLNGIAITDHNEIKGAKLVKSLNKDKNFEVIIGEEIKTADCEILAYNLNEKITATTLIEALEKAKQQGASVSIAHPFSGGIRSTLRVDLKKINYKGALEVFNARSIDVEENKKAELLANKLKLAKTAGSDGHFYWEIGKAYTMFDGDLAVAIKKRKTKVAGSNKFAAINRFLSTPIKLKNKLLR